MAKPQAPTPLPALLALSALGALSFSCAQSGATQGSTSNVANASVSAPTSTLVNAFNSTVGSSSTLPTGSAPPYTFNVGTMGYTSTTVTVSAGQVLRLTFTPGLANQPMPDTGVFANYSQLGVYITVGSLTQNTPMLTNGYNGTTAETSPVLDFSQALSGPCTESESSTCRGNFTITVSKPNTDYWCLNDGLMCPWNRISSDQPWNGTLTVETDDTQAIQ